MIVLTMKDGGFGADREIDSEFGVLEPVSLGSVLSQEDIEDLERIARKLRDDESLFASPGTAAPRPGPSHEQIRRDVWADFHHGANCICIKCRPDKLESRSAENIREGVGRHCGKPASGLRPKSPPPAPRPSRERGTTQEQAEVREVPGLKSNWKTPNEVRAESGVNPKDLVGSTKAPLRFIPPAALLHMGLAMELGGKKYGPFNWRAQPVQSGIYYEAALRHIMAWFDGEELDPESGAHHLGHAMACLGILLDAIEGGFVADTRPENKGPFASVADRIATERKESK